MSNPKVSIVIRAYNQEKYIEECLKSCFFQTFTDFEICIVDDCSIDNTVKIIKDYQIKYPNKINLVELPMNIGHDNLAMVTKKALEICKGEYISFLDSDDVMFSNRLEKQVEFLNSKKEYIGVYHSLFVFDTDINIKANIDTWKQKKQKLSLKNIILYGNYSIFPSLMMRKNSTVPDSSTGKMDDWFFNISLLNKGKIGYQDIKLTKYRRHIGNTSATSQTKEALATLALVDFYYPKLRVYSSIKRAQILFGLAFRNKNYLQLFSGGILFTLISIYYRITSR